MIPQKRLWSLNQEEDEDGDSRHLPPQIKTPLDEWYVDSKHLVKATSFSIFYSLESLSNGLLIGIEGQFSQIMNWRQLKTRSTLRSKVCVV